MIVKNEAANLPTSLGSVAELFDEMIVVDTGSSDNTKEIARSLGARVLDHIPGDHFDFATARNAALGRARADFALWLDGDDDPRPAKAKLKALLDSLDPADPAGYVLRCSCDPDEQGGGGRTVVDHIRLFPVRDDVRWTYPVHEQILPSLRRLNIPIRWTDITIRHTGYSDSTLRRK